MAKNHESFWGGNGEDDSSILTQEEIMALLGETGNVGEDEKKISGTEAQKVGENVKEALESDQASAEAETTVNPTEGKDRFGGDALSQETRARLEAAKNDPKSEVGQMLEGETIESRIDTLKAEEMQLAEELELANNDPNDLERAQWVRDHNIEARLVKVRADLQQLEQLQAATLSQLDETFGAKDEEDGGTGEADNNEAEAGEEEQEDESWPTSMTELEKYLEGKTAEAQIDTLESGIALLDRDIENAKRVMDLQNEDYDGSYRDYNNLITTRALMNAKLEELRNAETGENAPATGEVEDTADSSVEIDMLSPEASHNAALVASAAEIAELLGDPSIVARVKESITQNANGDTEEFISTEAGAMPSAEEFAPLAEVEDTERSEKVAGIMEKMKNRLGNSAIGKRVRRFAARAAVFVMTAAAGIGLVPANVGERTVASDAATEAEAMPGGDEVTMASFEDFDAGEVMANGGEVSSIDEAMDALDLYEAANGTRYGYGGNYDADNKNGIGAFGPDASANHGDIEATRAGILEVAMSSPEALAAIVASAPKSFGLESGATAESIDETLSNSENGGALQRQYLEKLAQLLEDDETVMTFKESSERQRSYIIVKEDENAASTPDNLKVQTYDKDLQRHGDKQVVIGLPIRDAQGNFTGEYEYIQLNESCDYQPAVTIEYHTDGAAPTVIVEMPAPEQVTPAPQKLEEEPVQELISDNDNTPERVVTPNRIPDPELIPFPPRPPHPEPTFPDETPEDPDDEDPDDEDPEDPDPGNTDPEEPDPGDKEPENPDPGDKDPEEPDPGDKEPEDPDPGNKDPEEPEPGDKEPEPEPEPGDEVKPKDPDNLFDHTAGEGMEGEITQNPDITQDDQNQETEAPIVNDMTGAENIDNSTEGNNQNTMTDQEIQDYLDQLLAQGDSGFDN